MLLGDDYESWLGRKAKINQSIMPMLNISEPNKLQQRIHIRHFPGMKRQNEACTQCIKQIQKARPHAWIAFIDIDELINTREEAQSYSPS